jgi:hypothetical protein
MVKTTTMFSRIPHMDGICPVKSGDKWVLFAATDDCVYADSFESVSAGYSVTIPPMHKCTVTPCTYTYGVTCVSTELLHGTHVLNVVLFNATDTRVHIKRGQELALLSHSPVLETIHEEDELYYPATM